MGIITEMMHHHLTQGGGREAEQKLCKRGCYGTINHLLLNKAMLENNKTRRTKLSTAWVDCKTSFDSIPHSWMIQCMQQYKINLRVIKLIEKAMELWNTTLILQHSEGKIEIPGVKIRRGIFQGDSLLCLLFCLGLDPLSNLINEQGHGYWIHPYVK